MESQPNSAKKFRKDLTPVHLTLFKIEKKGVIPKSFLETNIILIPKPDKYAAKKNHRQFL